jgi:hypothetical protein
MFCRGLQQDDYGEAEGSQADEKSCFDRYSSGVFCKGHRGLVGLSLVEDARLLVGGTVDPSQEQWHLDGGQTGQLLL